MPPSSLVEGWCALAKELAAGTCVIRLSFVLFVSYVSQLLVNLLQPVGMTWCDIWVHVVWEHDNT
jgi:hypothetical protein